MTRLAAPESNATLRATLSLALGVLLRPSTGWPRVSADAETVQGLSKNLVLPLSLIPALALAFGVLIIAGDLAADYQGAALTAGSLLFLQSLLVTYLFALAVQLVATRFASPASYSTALKLVAFSTVPIWFAGALLLVIPAQVTVILDASFLYAGYLLYEGCGPVLGVKRPSAVTFTLIAMVAWLLVFLISHQVLGLLSHS